ncbi:MAG: PfkB protein [Patescibacteria group bacterium]|nr:PfkB protein [Patescibacteria group bacterium]
MPTGEGKIIETPEDLTSQRKISFELGAKYAIEERFETLGGCAANVASGLSKLGVASECVAQVGNDVNGIWIREELRKNGAGLEMMQVKEGDNSDLSAIIVDKSSADRTIFSSKYSSGKLEYDREKMKEAEWIFIGDIHGKWEENLEEIIQLAKDENKRVAFNPRERNIHENAAEIIQAISFAEVVFVNKDEAIEIVKAMDEKAADADLNSEEFLIGKLKNLEPKVVALTNGKDGAWVTGDDGKTLFAKGLEVSAVDSTGAGDAFLSGFLSAYIKERDLSKCLKWGIANSASVVQHYGGIEGLLSEDELSKKAEEVEVKEINI